MRLPEPGWAGPRGSFVLVRAPRLLVSPAPAQQWVSLLVGSVCRRRARWAKVLDVIKHEGVFLIPKYMMEPNVCFYEVKMFRSILSIGSYNRQPCYTTYCHIERDRPKINIA